MKFDFKFIFLFEFRCLVGLNFRQWVMDNFLLELKGTSKQIRDKKTKVTENHLRLNVGPVFKIQVVFKSSDDNFEF